MRVNVQLIDAETGAHLWAERFDKPVGDLFDMQDEIVSRLANQLDAELIAVEARRTEGAPNPDSMDLYFQGRASVNKGSTPEYLMQARSYFERALACYPGNIDALIGTAFIDIARCSIYSTDNEAELLAAAESTLTKTLSQVPNNAFAHSCMGRLKIMTSRIAIGIAECERALALDRNLAGAHASIGVAKVYIGRADEAEAHTKEALRLSPCDTNAHVWFATWAFAKLHLNEFEEAIAILRRALDINQNYPHTHFWLSMAHAHLGQINQARAAAHAGLALNPTYTISRVRAGARGDNPTYLAQRERLIDDLRKAGVPEG